MNFFKQYALYISGIILLLIVIVIIFQYWRGEKGLREKRISKIVTVEGLFSDETPGLFPDSENPQAMCDIHLENPAIIDTQCKTFSKKNCNTVNCCVWNKGSCVGGTDNRPFYITD